MPINDIEFALLKQQVELQGRQLLLLETKLEKEIEKLQINLKESNEKLDHLIELANQAKGAGQAAKLMWVLGAGIAALVGWFAKTFMHG